MHNIYIPVYYEAFVLHELLDLILDINGSLIKLNTLIK